MRRIPAQFWYIDMRVQVADAMGRVIPAWQVSGSTVSRLWGPITLMPVGLADII